VADYPDGPNYIDLNAAEARDVRRLIQRHRRAEGSLTDVELDLIRRFKSKDDATPERLLKGHEGLSGRNRS
jgi:hypothetical protein